jgi:hypothetical protein
LQEGCFAGFAAKAQAPMVMADEPKLSPTAWTAVFQFSHEATSDLEIRRAVFTDGGANCRKSNLKVHISNDLEQ